MLNKTFIVVTFLTAFGLVSCSGNNNGRKGASSATSAVWDSTLKAGVLVDSVPCPDFPKLSYALYLPAGYKASKKYPCIYFFDSHANGALPLRHYKALAEEFGFVMIGSNISRNGISWQEANEGITEMMEDSRRRIHIDSDRIYTSGFSGGAKVASSAAIFNGGIAGVIACAGGMPPVEQEIQTHFDYFGIVGNQDFNLTSLEILHEKLGEYGFNQYLITFNGKHAWADSADFRTALLWMQFQAMKHGVQKRNDTLIKLLKDDFDNRIESTEKNNDLLLKRSLMVGICSLADTGFKVDGYKKDLAALQATPDMISAVGIHIQLRHNETSLQDTLARMFTEKDFSWWQTKIAELNLNIRTSENKDDAMMYARVVNYLGMLGYISTTKALKMGNMEQAAQCLKVFKKADPTNPDCSYLSALFFLKTGKNEDAMKSLEEAANLGYSEPFQLLTNPDLRALQGDERFQRVLAKVRLNAKQS